MKIDFKDIVKLQRLYIEIYEEEDGYPVDYRIVKNKERAVQRILDKITNDKFNQGEIWYIIQTKTWDREDNTYRPICNALRSCGYEIMGNDIGGKDETK